MLLIQPEYSMSFVRLWQTTERKKIQDVVETLGGFRF